MAGGEWAWRCRRRGPADGSAWQRAGRENEALPRRADMQVYGSMEPVINLEETIGKTVGNRRIQDAFAAGMALQRSGNQFLRQKGRYPVPRGVYRFKTHEEADAWMMKVWIAAAKD